MKKPVLWSVIILSAVLVAYAFGQEDMVVVENSVFENPQRTPALFEHDVHNEKAGLDDCAECHHVYDDDGRKIEDESSEDLMCYDCHDFKDDGRMPGLRKAFHANCKGCHLTERKGPIACAQCHVR